MGRLEDRLLNSSANALAADLRANVEALSQEQADAADEHSEAVIDRAVQVAEVVSGVLKAADPKLVTASALDGLTDQLNAANATASQLVHDPSPAPTLDDQLEGVLTHLTPLLLATPLPQKMGKQTDRAFTTALTEAVKSTSAKTEDITRRLDEIESRARETDERLTAEDEARAEALVETMTGLEGRVVTEQARLDQLVPTFEQRFSEAQDERKNEFTETSAALKKSAEETAEALQTQADEKRNELETNGQETLSRVDEIRADVESLYGVIADTATAGAFNKEAAAQKLDADGWRKTAVGFGVAALVIATLAILWSALDRDTASSAGAIVAKVTLTLAAAGIAAYAGRQSGRHREREENAKQLELELVSLGSFIHDMPAEQQAQIRADFVQRAFTGRDHTEGRSLFHKKDSFGLGGPEIVAIVKAAQSASSTP